MKPGRSLRPILTLMTLATVLAFAPAPAMHTMLKKSAPGANDTVAPPAAVRLWFTERVELPFTRVTLKNAAGATQPMGALAFANDSANAAVVAPVTGTLAPGEYTVTWSAAAKDGHPAKGSFRFVVGSKR